VLTFNRVSIKNFVGLGDIELDFASDPKRPLTVIRAENGSGKTTFLRALAWCLYGERSIPHPGANWPLHPIDWEPDRGPEEVSVAIEFTVDDETKDPGSRQPARYELTRSVTVEGRDGREPNWRRVNQKVRLMRHMPGSGWDEQRGAATMVAELLPWELREFFFTDADKAEDFLGGREGGEQLTHDQLVQRTTGAVRALLSLDVLRDAASRAERLSDAFRRRISTAIGVEAITRLQEAVERKKEEREELRIRNKQLSEELGNLKDALEATEASLEAALKGSGAYEELAQSMSRNRAALQKAKDERRDLALEASDALVDVTLLAALTYRNVCRVHDLLEPLEREGLIPLRHLPFVRDRLREGTCICGNNIGDPGKGRDTVLQLLVDSEARERKANYLGDVFNETRHLKGLATEPATYWPHRLTRLIDNLGTLDEELAALEREKEDLQRRLDGIDLELVDQLKHQRAGLEKDVERKELEVRKSEADFDELIEDIDSMVKHLAQQQRKHALDQDALKAMTVADDVADLMRRTYGRVANDQIEALSSRMNELFREMISAASGEIIHRVGIKISAPEEYEIFAERVNGDPLHVATMVNGASRRALAMAFILALAEQSGTKAPTVCDSLLNNTSGSVREGTLSVTIANSAQPILLMTRDEIHHVEDLLRDNAGRMYTLTGQWQANVEDDKSSEVVNRTSTRPVALLCECGIDEYCEICERRRDRDDARLQRRES
jgi:DNA sulfur modification protein DndD